MTVYIVSAVRKTSSRHSDCRCIDRIEATEYKGHRRIVLSPREAYFMVTRGQDRLWVAARGGFIPVVPAYHDGLGYVRTEPADTSEDVLVRQANLRAMSGEGV